MYGAETRGARQQKEPTESSALFFHSRIPKARLYLLESGRVSLDERLAELHLESILVHALGDLRVIVCIGFRRFEESLDCVSVLVVVVWSFVVVLWSCACTVRVVPSDSAHANAKLAKPIVR